MTLGSNFDAVRIAMSRSARSSTIVTPELEPARAGLTNTGSLKALIRASVRSRSRSHWLGKIVTYGICGNPAAENTVFVNGLSIPTELARTPAPT